MAKKITFVVAPTIPMSERIALQAHCDEAAADSDYTVITNYEVKTVELDPDKFLIVAAEGVATIEVVALRAQVDEIMNGRVPPVIVVNYEVEPLLVPRT